MSERLFADGPRIRAKCQEADRQAAGPVLVQENLPPLGTLPAGEVKTIAVNGAADFVASLDHARVVSRGPKGSRKKKVATTPMPAH